MKVKKKKKKKSEDEVNLDAGNDNDEEAEEDEDEEEEEDVEIEEKDEAVPAPAAEVTTEHNGPTRFKHNKKATSASIRSTLMSDSSKSKKELLADHRRELDAAEDSSVGDDSTRVQVWGGLTTGLLG